MCLDQAMEGSATVRNIRDMTKTLNGIKDAVEAR
jgi:hypothetical protein